MHRQETKILFMSGYIEYAEGAGGELAALGALMQKPFSKESLTAKVREVLSGTTMGVVDGTVANHVP